MASTATGIEWTETTWNPLRGCSRVSPGCEKCYAEKTALRFAGPGGAYEGLVRKGPSGARWTGAVRFVPEALREPLGWRKPRRIFVNSMSDLFHEKVTDGQIAAIFATMAACQQHTFQVLTKRAGRMATWFQWLRGRVDVANGNPALGGDWTETKLLNLWAQQWSWLASHPVISGVPWPLPNVWLGVSAEDQQRADERIPHLLDCPAAVRWVSYEPALGPVRFDQLGSEDGMAWLNALRGTWAVDGRGVTPPGPHLDWVVVGGESGAGARPFDVAWARSTVQQCQFAGVACFVKQAGARPYEAIEGCQELATFGGGRPMRLREPKGGDPSEWPEDLRVRQFPEVAHV